MRVWTVLVLVSLAALACTSIPDVGGEATAELCDLAERVDAIYDGVEEERRFTPEEDAAVEALVDEMQPLVPAELEVAFRLRYWPNTSVGGLDTGGVSTQRAYDNWRSFRSSQC